jgi:hypothetical protein
MTPPQDIEMRILTFRSELFSRLGYASSLALPVLIPLCLLKRNIPGQRINEALAARRFSGFPMTGSKVLPISNSFFLSLGQDESVIGLSCECKQILSSLPGGAESPEPENPIDFIPMYPGFFLAYNEKNSDEWEPVVRKIHQPEISFHHFFLSVCVIHIYSRGETWWKQCEWEIKEQVKSIK